ncbi:MAG: AAA family ATPase, partial [Thermoanaerobaculia bacterium]|nr:AAA family ATPase [Thermoanaerobaculia bacterium]
MRVVALYNIKGGVGKTAGAVNLGFCAAADRWRTLVWDLDPQGAASFYFRVRAKVRGGRKMLRGKRPLDDAIRGTDYPGLDLLPADFSYRKIDQTLDAAARPSRHLAELLQPLAESYDVVLLDCAPGISLVSEAIFVAADALLVPTIPTTLSLRTLDRLIRHLEKRRRRRAALLPYFSIVDRRKRLHREICDAAPGGRRPMLSTAIPNSTLVEQMGLR